MSYGIMEDQNMPRKKHMPEEIVAKLRQVDVLVSQGGAIAEAVRQIGVTEVTLCGTAPKASAFSSDELHGSGAVICPACMMQSNDRWPR